jgi:hypothetical protein
MSLGFLAFNAERVLLGEESMEIEFEKLCA